LLIGVVGALYLAPAVAGTIAGSRTTALWTPVINWIFLLSSTFLDPRGLADGLQSITFGYFLLTVVGAVLFFVVCAFLSSKLE
jgi:hypothetical protein